MNQIGLRSTICFYLYGPKEYWWIFYTILEYSFGILIWKFPPKFHNIGEIFYDNHITCTIPNNLMVRLWYVYHKVTNFKSFDNCSNRREGVLRLVHVSVGFPIRSSIFPLVPYSVLLCSVTCRSPNFFLSAPKRWSWSGFIKQFAIFTSVSILHTSTLFSVTSSQMWWNRTSMCFIFAW